MGLLFTAQHNKSITDEELAMKNAVRVDNWKEVYELITLKFSRPETGERS